MTAPNRGRRVSTTDRAPFNPSQLPSINKQVFVTFVGGKPVSVNSAYANRKPSARNRGTRRLTDAATTWRDIVIQSCRVALAERRRTISQAPIWWRLPLTVRVTLYGVRGDADNYLKLILDGLKVATGIDDKHFATVIASRSPYPLITPGAAIEVWQAEEAPAETAVSA